MKKHIYLDTGDRLLNQDVIPLREFVADNPQAQVIVILLDHNNAGAKHFISCMKEIEGYIRSDLP